MDKSTYRRNLSGIFIRDILPQDKGKRYPTCIEDCNEDTRLKWLERLEPEAIVHAGQHLNECYSKLWDLLTEEEQDKLGFKRYCDVTFDKHLCIERINNFCKLIRYISDCTGICAPNSEAATGIPLSDKDDD